MMLIYLLLRNGLFPKYLRMGVNPLKCLAVLGFLDRTNSCSTGVIQRNFVFVISLDGKKLRIKMINNPFAEDGIISCQCCGSGEYLFNKDGNRNGYCGNCGARIDWQEDKDGWKNTNTDLPKYGVLCKIKYKDGREDTAVLSSYIGWHTEGVLNTLKEPDYWRYMIEEEKNGA
uniref:TFIIB zinc-binding n=1 Tax=Siphoviridae sp. ctGa111 TaxID=2825413 RepID=A0A8S5VDS2_9CAUD|nr:MAG TPA: TFIIB zinc-binding [Siphoviridae sp. ctGa111]